MAGKMLNCCSVAVVVIAESLPDVTSVVSDTELLLPPPLPLPEQLLLVLNSVLKPYYAFDSNKLNSIQKKNRVHKNAFILEILNRIGKFMRMI